MSIRPLILALVLAVPAGAHADQLDGATIDLTLKVRDGDSFIVPNDVDIPRYFNQARCLCDSDDDKEYQVEYTWAGTAPSPLPNATRGGRCGKVSADCAEGLPTGNPGPPGAGQSEPAADLF